MRAKPTVLAISALELALTCMTSQAGSLEVAPVLIDVQAPAAASKLILRNVGATTLNAQVRVYRWTQVDGTDRLTETRDVVASPPLTQIPANGQQLVRIVRVAKQPPEGEESYRLLVDEISQVTRHTGVGVNFSLRYSIPVFFGHAADRTASPEWTIHRGTKRLLVTARNFSDRRIRISAMKLSGPRVGTVSYGNGLVGYVLARSTAQWQAKGVFDPGIDGSKVDITAKTENGPVLATAVVQAP